MATSVIFTLKTANTATASVVELIRQPCYSCNDMLTYLKRLLIPLIVGMAITLPSRADIYGVHESIVDGVITLINNGSDSLDVSPDHLHPVEMAMNPPIISIYVKKEHGVIDLTSRPGRPGYVFAEAMTEIPDHLARQRFNRANFQKYHAYIQSAAARYHVKSSLIDAVISAESGFNPNAVSSKGADGLMQLMPATALRFGVQNVFDPRENIDGGVAYLAHLEQEFTHRQRLVIAAYNAGGQSVIAAGYRIPDFAETMRYVPTVLAYEQQYTR